MFYRECVGVKKLHRMRIKILRCACIRNLAGGLAQSEERNVSNVEAPGSKPGFSSGNIIFLTCCSVTAIRDNNDASLA